MLLWIRGSFTRGEVRVTVEKADGLKTDRQSAELYIEATLDGDAKRSRRVAASACPVWNETFVWPDSLGGNLKFEIRAVGFAWDNTLGEGVALR